MTSYSMSDETLYDSRSNGVRALAQGARVPKNEREGEKEIDPRLGSMLGAFGSAKLGTDQIYNGIPCSPLSFTSL